MCRLTLLIVISLLSISCGDVRQPIGSPPSEWDGAPGLKDDGGVNDEEGSGQLPDNDHDDGVPNHNCYDFQIATLKVNDKDSNGAPWDPDGPPDLLVVISTHGNVCATSPVAQDTLVYPTQLPIVEEGSYAENPCVAYVGTSLRVQVFDVDGTGAEATKTLIGEAFVKKLSAELLDSDVQGFDLAGAGTSFGLQSLKAYFFWSC